MKANRKTMLLDNRMLIHAVKNSFIKLSPKVQMQNPVIFFVYLSALLTTWISIVSLFADKNAGSGFASAVAAVLWLAVLLANFVKSIAEERDRAQTASLRNKASLLLHKGDIVLVVAGEQIPADGEVMDGAAPVDESAITGESVPVIRASGGDRALVTGGTTVISDWLLVRVDCDLKESFLDRMTAMAEAALRKGHKMKLCYRYFL